MMTCFSLTNYCGKHPMDHIVVKERISKNVYRVKQELDTVTEESEKVFLLYSTEMVKSSQFDDQIRVPTSPSVDTAKDHCISKVEMLNRMREFADRCREDVNKRSY